MSMTIKGKVTNRNEVAAGQGHSQVRISAVMDLGDGVERQVEVILSTPDYAVLDAFGRNEEVEFERKVA